MGWFWAETPSQSIAPHPISSRSDARPPPSCPMHNKIPLTPPPASDAPRACPVKHDATSSGASSPSYISRLNPLNYMPSNLSNKRESDSQSVNLPLEREMSSIPRGDGGGTWEYPSPQQMFNAMLRKGYTDTPAEHVESMVAVHNFLNEGAWEEIKGWEGRFGQGLYKGWERCAKGEEGYEREAMLAAFRRRAGAGADSPAAPEPKLLRFQGRPDDPTPKARMLSFMAWLYPSQFPDNPPFDRHDWFVHRQLPDGSSKEIRYVIDYRSGPPEPTGEPVFYLDVRPAIDGPTAACERMVRWGGDIWWRASGGSAREDFARQRK